MSVDRPVRWNSTLPLRLRMQKLPRPVLSASRNAIEALKPVCRMLRPSPRFSMGNNTVTDAVARRAGSQPSEPQSATEAGITRRSLHRN